MVCDACLGALKQGHYIEGSSVIAPDKAERVFDEICANCYDYNRPLIDDMLGSSE